MNLDNEVINQLLRTQKGRRTFAKSVSLAAHYFNEHGEVRPERDRIPLLDALACLIDVGIGLCPDQIHPPELVGIDAATSAIKDLMLSLVRVENPQPDLINPTEPLHKLVDKEVKDAVGAHRVAEKVLKRAAPVDDNAAKSHAKARLSMDEFVEMVAASPSPDFTKVLLANAGPDQVRWISPAGPLPLLDQTMTASLPAKKSVEINARILYVRDKQGTAVIEIDSCRDDYSSTLLCHYGAEVELRFDAAQVERDDLVLMQYFKGVVPLRATAMCATSAKVAKKTVLTLSKILVTRAEMDKLHTQFHQLQLPLEGDEPM